MAELISSMFDVDAMLYFVAPEWWVPKPRTHTRQNLTGSTAEPFTSDQTVSWGGAKSNNRPNYYITEDSTPARLGSSLGWLLQLDGDDLRNAFLNAPWVKAVIPIRPGKELAALNWLTKAHVEGSDGLDGRYQVTDEAELEEIVEFLEAYPWAKGDNAVRYHQFASRISADPKVTFVTIRDALTYLALSIKQKDAKSRQVVPGSDYLPTDRVFEHGFDPLANGFKAEGIEPFETFDTWVEVLPTDQIVAVEVKYDPKTGQMI